MKFFLQLLTSYFGTVANQIKSSQIKIHNKFFLLFSEKEEGVFNLNLSHKLWFKPVD